MIKWISAATLIIALIFSTHPQVAAQAATIGPGTPCTVTVSNPTTNNDGTPLTVPVLKMSFYLDPPAGGPVIGTTVPLFTQTYTATQGIAGAPNTISVCAKAPAPIASGNHTASISFTDAGGEGAGSSAVPFVFAGKPPAAPLASGIIFQ